MPEPSPPHPAPLSRRLAWFVALWGVGAGTVGIVALILRAWLKA